MERIVRAFMPVDWRRVVQCSKLAPPMPLHIPFRGILFFFFPWTFGFLSAQTPLSLVAQGTVDSIAVTGFVGDPGSGAAVFRADWTGMDGQAPAFKFKEPAGQHGDSRTSLDELIIAGVEQYLDQRVHFTRDGVQVDIPVPRLASGIDRMIGTAAARFGAPAIPLSAATKEQLGRVSRIDWSQATFGIDGGDDQEKYLAIYYYVRAQRQELERQLHNDLIQLSTVDVLPPQGAAQRDPGKSEPVPTVCSTVFDEENYLCALDLKMDSGKASPDVKLTDAMLSDIAMKAKEAEELPPAPKLRKRDRWLKAELDAINRRIDQSDQRKELWALRDRMDDMEGRLDDIGLQVDELKTDRAAPGTTDNPVATLSALTGRNVTVRFSKGSSDLEPNERALLAEVALSMRQAPNGRVLVTGYADKTGDPGSNLALSERRAKAVRSYLLGQGIDGSRVLMNYYGSSQSSGSDPSERRVELEWVR